MTPQDPEDRPTEFGTEEEQEVSRLLAEAAGPVVVPDDVAARLDDVLAGLVHDRAGSVEGPSLVAAPGSPESPESPAVVVDLRRRRRWPRMLLAAAAVVVAGYGVGGVVHGSLTGSADSSPAADAAGDSGGAAAAQQPQPEDGRADSLMSRGAGTVVLHSDRLASDVRRALAETPAKAPASGRDNPETLRDRGCPPPRLGAGETWWRATYDGRAAVLVTGPRHRGTVEARVYSCSGDQLDSATVRTP